ncbi:MAG: hypothetical protein HQL03_11260 [Nitrospirae bacterium]|nr:hypothetical protein [Nitrospirota bacterium]
MKTEFIRRLYRLASRLRDRANDITTLHYLDDAYNVLIKAIEKTKRKHILCGLLGEIEFLRVNSNDGINWWVQGVLLQESQPREGDNRYGGTEFTEITNYWHLYNFCLAQRLKGGWECKNSFMKRVIEIKLINDARPSSKDAYIRYQPNLYADDFAPSFRSYAAGGTDLKTYNVLMQLALMIEGK